jgi:hypothetical protein
MLCKIGDVEIWRILDWHGLFRSPEDLFPNAPEDVARIVEDLAPGSVDAARGRLILPVQGFLLKTSGATILVDACIGNHKTVGFDGWAGRDDNRFLAGLTAAGVTPADVDVVFCTHLHVDHFGWNTRLENGQWVPTFPNARYLFPAEDEAHYGENPGEAYTESVLPVIAAGQAVTWISEISEISARTGSRAMTLTPLQQEFVLHFGEMGSRWGINRTVGQIYALLFLSRDPLNAEQITDALSISRSNTSMGLKELQSWSLVRLKHFRATGGTISPRPTTCGRSCAS